jgi:hypothetical protein
MKKTTKKIKTAGIGKVVLGTAIGVGIGAAAVALSSEENRKAVAKKTSALKKDAEQSLKNGKKELQGVRKTLEKKMDVAMKEYEPEAKQAKKTAKSVSKKIATAKNA